MSNSFYINSNSNSFLTNKYMGNSSTSLYEKGNVITGTISSIDSNIAILKISDSDNMKFPAGSIVGGVGDTVSFEVLGQTKDGLSLKQIFNDKSDAYAERITLNQANTDNMMDLFKQHNMATDENMFDTETQEKELEEDLKVQQAIRKIRQQLAFSNGNTSGVAISELAAAGLSAEKIDLTTLNTVMQEIDSKPPVSIKFDEFGNSINKSNENIDSEIAQKLSENGVEVTDKNIDALNTLLTKLDEISNLDAGSIKEFVKSEKPLTLENVYISKYSSTKETVSEQTNSSLWNDLKSEVVKIFDKEGIDINIDSLKAAKFLIDNELPIQKENVENVMYLQNVSQNANRDFFIQGAIANIQKGNVSSQIDLTATSNTAANLYKDYQKVIDGLPNVSGEKINVMLSRNIPLTLNNIVNLSGDVEIDETIDLPMADSAITAKRQMTEIALKLTSESAYRLSGKNLNINTMPLEEALATLKDLENESYSKNLKIMGAEVSNENVEKMGDLFNQLETIKQYSPMVSTNILDKSTNFTIEESANSINLVQTAKVLKDFEDLATTVSSKYGDSFQDVKEQFADLLDRLSIPSNEENIKSAKILSKSGLDIDYDNILKIDTIMSKLDRVTDTLHPNIAANMIKEGLNPSTMHIDEVLDYIDEFGGQYGENLKDKIPKYIVETDKNKEFSPEIREGMIAVYRMLNTIEKNDSVALGVTVKSGSEITLGNLLESSKYYSRTKGKVNDMDFSAGDNETNRLRTSNSENNIRNILENSTELAYKNIEESGLSKDAISDLLEQSNMGETADNIFKAKMTLDTVYSENTSRILTEFEYNHEKIETFSNKAFPENLSKLMQNDNVMDRNINELLSNLEDMEQEDSVNQSFKSIENIANGVSEISPEIVNFMKENSVPLNINNTKSMSSFAKNSHYMGDVVGDIAKNLSTEDFEELLDTLDIENLKTNTPEELLQNASELLEDIKTEQATSDAIENLDIARLAVDTQRIIHQNDKGNWLELPIKMNDSVAGLNMYVVNDNMESSDENGVYFSLNTQNLGNVQLFAKTNGNSVHLDIMCENNESAEFLRNSSAELSNGLSLLGFEVENIEYKVKNMEIQTTVSSDNFYENSNSSNSNIEVII